MEREYIQRFSDAENITVQCVVSPSATLSMKLQNLCSGVISTLSPVSHDINDSNKLLEFIIHPAIAYIVRQLPEEAIIQAACHSVFVAKMSYPI